MATLARITVGMPVMADDLMVTLKDQSQLMIGWGLSIRELDPTQQVQVADFYCGQMLCHDFGRGHFTKFDKVANKSAGSAGGIKPPSQIPVGASKPSLPTTYSQVSRPTGG